MNAQNNTKKAREILVVDDESQIREAVTKDLALVGETFNIHQAVDGVEALQVLKLLQQQKLDLAMVITDMEMPNMNGIELLAEIRKTHGLTKLPILMLTSVNDKSRVIEAISLNVTNYLIKPWTAYDLVDKVAFCLKKGEESKKFI